MIARADLTHWNQGKQVTSSVDTYEDEANASNGSIDVDVAVMPKHPNSQKHRSENSDESDRPGDVPVNACLRRW